MKHRERLTKQMEKVYSYHDRIQQLITDDTKLFSNQPLLKKIDEWEQESILKIQQTANNVRQELKDVLTKHTIEMEEIFSQISQELKKVRVENNYIETDIQTWKTKLHQLKKDIQTPKTIHIEQDKQINSFINKIKLCQLSIDSFHQAVGDIHTIDHDLSIMHGPSTGDATIRGKREYYSGTHRFRFQIEKLNTPKWVFFGIVSKTAPLQSHLDKTPTTYGWAGHHQVWLNGIHHHQYNGYQCEMDTNHIIEVIIDCDKQKIHLTNETTSAIHEISVSITKCPLPWILYIGLYGADDRICLLPV
jgi:hypothetical protein